MSLLSSPKVLYSTRIAQLLLGIIFLVLVCYDGTHRAWWTSINGPLAVGVLASIFTFAVTVYSIFTHHRSNPFSGGTATITIARIAAEVLVFLVWVASAALMLRPREGCEQKRAPDDGPRIQFCRPAGSTDENAWKEYNNQPIVTWNIAIAISLIEAVSFIATVVMVWMDDRKSKVSGGTSYA